MESTVCKNRSAGASVSMEFNFIVLLLNAVSQQKSRLVKVKKEPMVLDSSLSGKNAAALSCSISGLMIVSIVFQLI